MRARGASRALRSGDEDFLWSGGVRIARTSIWCDAPRAAELSFVSHAHLPLLPRRGRKIGAGHVRVIATARTLALRAALGEERPADRDVLVAPLGRPFALGRLRLELLPSGHVPGAAQLLVERPGRRVLYAGDVNPHGGRTVEPMQVRGCDAVLFDAPLAPLARALPPREEIDAALIAQTRRALDEGATPILLTDPIGGAGEVAALLAEAGVPFRVHRKIATVLAASRAFDAPIDALPAKTRRFSKTIAPGEALLWPAGTPPPRLANLRALAVPPFGHADLPSLVCFAKDAGARDVYLLATQLSDAVERAFQAARVRLHALGPPEQKSLFGGA